MSSKRVLISGGSGLVGRRLTDLLLESNYEVAWLSRSKRERVKTFLWDVKAQAIDDEAVEWADTIVHLAGEGVANKRWTADQKKKILDSRIDSSQLLYESISKSKSKVSHFISASAIGYYGMNRGDEELTESSSAGNDFLADVTKEWELTVDQIATLGIPVAKLRIGVVLSEKGGALTKIAAPVKLWAGAPLGSGLQYMSWIHLEDLCAMFARTIEHQLEGVYNATAPNPVTNKVMTKVIAKILNKPCFLPNVPGFVLKILLGDMSQMILGGSYVVPGQFTAQGFSFKYPELNLALADLLR